MLERALQRPQRQTLALAAAAAAFLLAFAGIRERIRMHRRSGDLPAAAATSALAVRSHPRARSFARPEQMLHGCVACPPLSCLSGKDGAL